ncbi:uncharacterized protein LOC127245454 [Andrographis paniculata]|uniref:uncharacterized protein LOC127245454 n=1 Tax=Andrographis paniculata TaxID=175694 RepID=UPI0021E7AB40|nr:uncharacterized protein LOC127245454 [Andrographis paniculata]
MPASPATKISPRRGLREDNHKRGRSLESGIRSLEKDDDLTLFNEAQNKERESFLLQQNDNFDDIFSTKLRYFSDYKLGISIPARGESSDLLNAEGDKNDYDWLITPPETPLFPSLDDEASPATLAPRGRPRSQPISVSRASTMEKGAYRSARGSASPLRHSPSPRSGTSPLQSRSRPFSATHSSPPPTLRNSYPSRRLSPPPTKPTPASAPRTLTPRRMSTGSTGSTPSKARGTSPSKTSRGNSTSPKINAWQSNIPGFNLEAPPNLRTSLADRPASYVRGSSPASRNSSRSGRQSMSPTGSRSVSSSHSHEREKFGSHSRGSVVSSFDDEVDSLHSIPVSSSERSVPRSTSSFQNNRAVGFSKKPAKVSSSAPKRSFDLALRQMERKGPQNMFRPLLSSVPSSTFYVGKANAHHRTLTSRNSSITTSSNASSDQGTTAAIDAEESEQNQEVTSNNVKGQFLTVQDEVFVMDQIDAANVTSENQMEEESYAYRRSGKDGSTVVSSQPGAAEASSQFDTAIAVEYDGGIMDGKYESLHVDGALDVEICSKCNRKFHVSELVMEGDLRICQECKSLEVNSTEIVPAKQVMADEHDGSNFVQNVEGLALEDLNPSISIPETAIQHVANFENNSQHPYSESIKDLVVTLIEEQDKINHYVNADSSHQQSVQSGNSSDSKIDISEGMGISLVLKRSSSGSRGHFVQSRSFTASNTSFEDFSYVRDSLNSMRSSIGRSTASVSSSVDLGSSRQTDARNHRQLSSQKSDMESHRHEMISKHKRSLSSLSGASGHASQVPSVTPSYPDDLEVIATNNFNKEVGGVINVDQHSQTIVYDGMEAESTCTDVESNTLVKTAVELSSRSKDDQTGDTHMNPILTTEEQGLQENGDSHGPTQKEDATQNSCVNTVDALEFPYPSSLDAISEMEIENTEIVSAGLPSEVDSPNLKCTAEFPDTCVSVLCDDVTTATIDIHPENGVLGESSSALEDINGAKSRGLTLEEAADSILFCQSIVHNLAYEAANIAIDKESPPVEVLQPALTFMSKSTPDRREMRSRKHSSKQKARQKKLEANHPKLPFMEENHAKSTPRVVVSPSKGDTSIPPKLESKCNCTIM